MYQHQSVLLDRAVDACIGDPDGVYIDGTYGRGGHSCALLARLGPQARLLVFDKDPAAIADARQLADSDPRVEVCHASFAEMSQVCATSGVSGQVQAVLLDLGVSSPQLDDAERGFSFLRDGPLDMRMDNSRGQSAEDWINSASAEEIANVLYEYGEERFSRRMARAIVAERERERITRTARLAEIIKVANPAWERHKHPATRAFQGIRIFINQELSDLRLGLDQACDVLVSGGRLVVISFHSLEDRIVKRFIQEEERGGDFPPGVPVMQSQLSPRLKRQGKAIRAEVSELEGNVRARSAVMRVAVKLEERR